MRPHNSLARQLDALVRTHAGHAVREQQQDKTPVQQINSEQVRHEGQLRVELEDLADGLRRRDGMRRTAVESRARDPVVVVVQHRDGVPLAVEQHVQHVQDVRRVRRHELQPGPVLGARGCCGGRRRRRRRWQRRLGRHVGVARDEVLDAGPRGARRGHRRGVLDDLDLLPQLVDAGLAVRQELADDGHSVRVVDHAQAGVEPSVVHLDDIAEDAHKWEEVFEKACAGDDG